VEDRAPWAGVEDCRSLGDILPAIMKKLGLEAEQWLMSLQPEWVDLMGPAVAKHTRPGRMDRKRLVVFVDSSVWLNELKRFGRTELLDKLQARFGKDKIESVSLEMDPDG
jgi:predicted nucleic acid-binding Zn ribbon protein